MFSRFSKRAELRTGWLHLAGCACLIAANEIASAADQPAAARYVIEQPAQPLGESLLAIARLTYSSLLFDPAVVQGRCSSRVSGYFSAVEAISAALAGTGLTVDVVQGGAMVVKPASSTPGPSGRSVTPLTSPDQSRTTAEACTPFRRQAAQGQ